MTLPLEETAAPEPSSGNIGSSGHLRDRVSLSETEETQQRVNGQEPERYQTSASEPEDISTERNAPLAEAGASGSSEQATPELSNAESTGGEVRPSQAQGGEGGEDHHHHRLSDLCAEGSADGGKVPLVEPGTEINSFEQVESNLPKKGHAGYTATKSQGEGHEEPESDSNRRSSVPWAESIAAEHEASLEVAGTADTSSGRLSFDSPNAAAKGTVGKAPLSKAEMNQGVAFVSMPVPLSEKAVIGEAPLLEKEAVAKPTEHLMPGRLQGGEEAVSHGRNEESTRFTQEKRRPSVSWAEELVVGISTSADILVGVLEPPPSKETSLEPTPGEDHGGVVILSRDGEGHRVGSEGHRRSSVPWVDDVAALSSTSQEAHTLKTLFGQSKPGRPSIGKPDESASFSTGTEDLGRPSHTHRTSVSWVESIAIDKNASISEVEIASSSEKLSSRAPSGVSVSDLETPSKAREGEGTDAKPRQRTSIDWVEEVATPALSESRPTDSPEQTIVRAESGVSVGGSGTPSESIEDAGKDGASQQRSSISWAEDIANESRASVSDENPPVRHAA